MLLCGLQGRQSLHFSRFSFSFSFFFIVDYYLVWSSCQDKGILFYLKIPENFVRLILQDEIQIVHIPFFRLTEFLFLSQFPISHLPHLVTSSLIFFIVLICCIHLLYDWSFRLYHHITYTRYFVTSYLFFLM